MSRLKIEHGASKTERVKLQVSIDEAIANDIELFAEWSNNEKNYIVNELLRFALGESAEFQQHKQTLPDALQKAQEAAAAKSVVATATNPSRTTEAAR